VVRVRTARAERETALVRSALVEVDRVAASNENLMPALLVAARAGATIGEISDVLRARFGEYREPGLW
jgi:methylmalonyl-CoA mutase N-terminal domain/subunit